MQFNKTNMKNRIKEVITARGITQKQLAEMTGMSEIGIGKAIKGSATETTLAKIADVLGVDVEELKYIEKVLLVKYGSDTTTLKLGSLEIPCYVLEDGTRVFSGRGIQRILGSESQSGQWLSRFVNRGTLSDVFMAGDNSISERVNNPIKFSRKNAGGVQSSTYGYEVTLLIDLCSAILDENRAGRFNDITIVSHADIIIRSVAKVGIIALVDEVTGYNKDKQKAKDELQKFLQSFLNDEAAKWVKTFSDQFFEDLYRMRHWNWDKTAKRPGVVGTWINDIVYQRIAPAILEELKRRNPKDINGNRKWKHHQLLTSDVGKPKLLQHLEALHALAVVSNYDWARFMAYLDRTYPKQYQQLQFLFDDEE